MNISIVTWNTGKYHQIAWWLGEVVTCEQVALDIPEIQTNLLTEISRDKCIQAFQQLKKPCLVDDSGIYFSAFHEFPGALTKFLYQGIGLAGIQRMYVWVEDMTATFQCALSYMDETCTTPLQFVGEIQGTISFDRLGEIPEDTHLPYDLIFIPDGADKPASFLWDTWLQDNHRVRAVRQLGHWLQDTL